jgi:hypothetical protein
MKLIKKSIPRIAALYVSHIMLINVYHKKLPPSFRLCLAGASFAEYASQSVVNY